MTEAEWLACTDLDKMLAFLRKRGGFRDGGRKFRLFACACCRQLWGELTGPGVRQAVEAAERAADGLLGDEECRTSAVRVRAAMHEDVPRWTLYRAVCEAADWGTGKGKAAEVARLVGLAAHRTTGELTLRRHQPGLLRDVFGPLAFRPTPITPAVLVWGGGTVLKLAQTIYEEHAFDRLPVLADALEEAGCTDQQILRHCREPGEHVRGCWVIDLLLTKA